MALWVVLPVAVFIAAYTPGTAPFAIGQAAFTVTVAVLFNLLAPVGWKVGVLRIEDVAIGCGVSILAGLLFWPRGIASLVGDDLADAFREILALVWPELSRHRIVVHQLLDEDLPPLLGARVQLQQVALNLIMNAIDAMADVSGRSRELAIRAQRQEFNGREGVLVAVEDTGAGLAQETLEKVFDPFYTTKEHGLGMGLSICRSIIEAHGGRLWATPNAGPGATFEFVLPASLES